MDLEKKFWSYVYGLGRVFTPVWNKHSRGVLKRLRRTQKRGAKAKMERMEKNDE